VPNNAQTQNDRRDTIRELLLGEPAATQSALVSALTGRGFVATQSSVSRDLKELGAVKTPHGYELPKYSRVDDDEIAKVADLIRDLKPAGPNLLIIKTGIGAAQRVALALDRSNWSEIVGNVGGDDTVFVATTTATAQQKVVARINHHASRA
jgi:transcriptional regulator of arginine metabolism